MTEKELEQEAQKVIDEPITEANLEPLKPEFPEKEEKQ